MRTSNATNRAPEDAERRARGPLWVLLITAILAYTVFSTALELVLDVLPAGNFAIARDHYISVILYIAVLAFLGLALWLTIGRRKLARSLLIAIFTFLTLSSAADSWSAGSGADYFDAVSSLLIGVVEFASAAFLTFSERAKLAFSR